MSQIDSLTDVVYLGSRTWVVFYEGTLQLGTNCAIAVVSCEISIVLVFRISVGAWYSAMQA